LSKFEDRLKSEWCAEKTIMKTSYVESGFSTPGTSAGPKVALDTYLKIVSIDLRLKSKRFEM
jgi:hypothetical protein